MARDKSIKASNILEHIGKQLKLITKGSLSIVTDPRLRNSAFYYPVEILTQKYHLTKGQWYLRIGSDET